MYLYYSIQEPSQKNLTDIKLAKFLFFVRTYMYFLYKKPKHWLEPQVSFKIFLILSSSA